MTIGEIFSCQYSYNDVKGSTNSPRTIGCASNRASRRSDLSNYQDALVASALQSINRQRINMSEVNIGESTNAVGAPYPQDEAPASFAQLVDQFSAAILLADAELSKENHDEKRVGIYMSDVTSIQDDLASQLPAAAREFGPDNHHIKLLQKVMHGALPAVIKKLEAHKSKLEASKAALRQQYNADIAALDSQLAEGAKALAAANESGLDNNPAREDDENMNATTDKDYIDAKLQAATAQMIGDIKAANAATDGRLTLIEQSIAGKVDAIGHQITAQIADMKATASARSSDNVKWMAATMITLAALSMAYMTFLVNNSSHKPASPTPAPIVIYAQPPSAVVAPSPPALTKP